MVAFSRYLDADGQTRLGLFRKNNDHAQHSNQVCPIEVLTNRSYEKQLLANDSFVQLNHGTIADFQEPNESQWLPAPLSYLPPVQCPEKLICIGLNYLDHAIETGAEAPTEPVVFSKFNSAMIGHGQTIDLPKLSKQVDYEAELVVVIGSKTRHVDPANAMQHVFGYIAGHDVSARDWQKGRPGGQWLLGKSFDTFAPVGPAIVTADEIDDPGNLRVQMHLNGECVQDSTTQQLIFDIPTLISHLSHIMTLQAGDMIFTGTPPGVGAARNPPRFLKDGDECTVEIEGVGQLSNPCRQLK